MEKETQAKRILTAVEGRKVGKIRIIMKAYEPDFLEKVCARILETLAPSNRGEDVSPEDTTQSETELLSIDNLPKKVRGPIRLPTTTRRYCVLTSPHVNKSARDHFEIRTHKRIIDLIDPTWLTYQKLTELSIEAGIDINIQLFE